MIKRIVRMSFHPGKVNAFREIYRRNWQHIRGFPGCRHVELLQAADHEGVFFTWSIWKNENALEAYRRSELFKEIWTATKALFNDKPLAWTVREITP